MKTNLFIVLLCVLSSTIALANGNPAVERAAKNMKMNDVRSVIRVVENTGGNPCMPEGKSFQVDLQAKIANGFDHETKKIIYSWETVKTIGVDNDGTVMEVCAE